MEEKIDVILMAAGLSKRFGKENKLLHRFNGRQLIEYTLDLVTSYGKFNEIWLVYSDSRVKRVAENYAVNFLLNEMPEDGISRSIHLGVKASTADYYMFLPCDQPFLDDHTLDIIVGAATKKKIVCPMWRGEGGTPTLFSSFFRTELLNLRGDHGGKGIMKKNIEDVIEIPVSSKFVLFDIDSKEDETLANQKKSPTSHFDVEKNHEIDK